MPAPMPGAENKKEYFVGSEDRQYMGYNSNRHKKREKIEGP